ncbi:MAG TPA: alpha/beta hydrolase [Terriglobales bacterium]|nr:alpha/beta hydrolase [Terriglobales bacterium]
MQGWIQRVVRAGLLLAIAFPRPASAGGLLAPYILHPIRHRITMEQVMAADQSFVAVGANRVDVEATAHDGIVLRGWKVTAAHPNGDWVLLLHGRSQNRLSMMKYANFLLRSGYSVVMMDARAHGESGGAVSTYGHIEQYDSTAILDALTAQETVRHVYALGESMGAAVALQSAAVEPRIEGVVAEGAFCNLHEVMYDYAGIRWNAFLGKTLFRPAAMMAVYETEHQVGFDLDEVSPEASVAQRAFPVLLVSGLKDHNIPKRHAQAIFIAARGPKELWLVPGAHHQQALKTAPEEFQRRVLKFFATGCPAP